MRFDQHAWRVLADYGRTVTTACDQDAVDTMTCSAMMALLEPETSVGAAILVNADAGLIAAHAHGSLTLSPVLFLRPSAGVLAVLAAGGSIRYPGGLAALQLPSPGHRPAGDVVLAPIVNGGRAVRFLAAAAASIDPAFDSALGALAGFAAVVYSARPDTWIDAVVRNAADPVLLLERDGSIRTASDGAVRLLGSDLTTSPGALLVELVHPDDAEALLIRLGRTCDQKPVDVFELRCRHADGGWIHTEAAVTARLGGSGVRGLVVRLRDVHERKALEAELAHWAFHDSKTGLGNRALLREALQRAIHAAIRSGASVILVLLGLDAVAEIAESIGHDEGDRLLTAVADRFRECIGTEETVARIGQTAFAILTVGQPATADELVRRFTGALREPIPLAHGNVQLTASIGIRITEPDSIATDRDADQILREAELAMYAVKSAGDATPQKYHPDLQRNLDDQLTMRAVLTEAVRTGEFVLHYQPIIELATRRISGFEALIRWQHPERGLISPDNFIPEAEKTGLIIQLGAWGLEQACADATHLRRAGNSELIMSVNVSPRQLQSDDIIGVIEASLRASALPAASLCIEITESALANSAGATKRLSRLRALDVHLALDDFGTGYASYGQLQSLPIDTIKIDRTFTEHLSRAESRPALARDMIRMGLSLGLRIVAEGVETADQEHELRDLDCQFAQGYLFGRPMPLAEALAQLKCDRADRLEDNLLTKAP